MQSPLPVRFYIEKLDANGEWDADIAGPYTDLAEALHDFENVGPAHQLSARCSLDEGVDDDEVDEDLLADFMSSISEGDPFSVVLATR